MVKQASDQQGNFAAGRAFIHMGLINHEQQLVGWVAVQPRLCTRPYRGLTGAEQHIFQHRVVRNQDVRTDFLHLKPGNQLCILRVRNMAAFVKSLQKRIHIRFGGYLALFDQLVKIVLLSRCLGEGHPRQSLFQ